MDFPANCLLNQYNINQCNDGKSDHAILSYTGTVMSNKSNSLYVTHSDLKISEYYEIH